MSNPSATPFYKRPAGWSRALGSALRDGARRLLPQHCTLCAAPSGDALVCPGCASWLPRLPPACPRCALPSPDAAVCGACLAHPPPFDATLAALAYAFPVDRLLQAFKYGGRLALADWAAAMLVERVRAGPADAARAPVCAGPPLLVPLPLSPARQRQRGFNQAREIARVLGALLALPVAAALCRPRTARPQASLPWVLRLNNVRGAFDARIRLDRRHVILVDDVMTTGATLAEAATVARRSGALRIDCWVVARTLPPGQT